MICFVVHTYKDVKAADRVINSILEVYGDACVRLISDVENHLYGKDMGRWIRRWMVSALEFQDCDTIIKLDADALVLRPLSFIPNTPIFGCLRGDGGVKRLHLMGGCEGFSRKACEIIVKSGLLADETYLGEAWKCSRMSKKYNESLFSESLIMNDIIRRLNFSLCDHSEIFVNVEAEVHRPERYSIIHPAS
jgi:hypothetical protein